MERAVPAAAALEPEPEPETTWATGGWCIVCRACRSAEVCGSCGVAPEQFAALRAELLEESEEQVAEFREAFECFADGDTQQLHGPDKLGALLRAMGMIGPRAPACDQEVDSLCRQFSLAGDGGRVSWEGFRALLLTRKRLENVAGETISAELEVLGVLRDYRRRTSEVDNRGSDTAGMTESKVDQWLAYWESLREACLVMDFDDDGSARTAEQQASGASATQRKWAKDDFAALACLEGAALISEQDLADLRAKFQLPPCGAQVQHAHAVDEPSGTGTGAGGGGSRSGSEGVPLAYREVVRRVFKKFGHADCVQADRIVWFASRTRGG